MGCAACDVVSVTTNTPPGVNSGFSVETGPSRPIQDGVPFNLEKEHY